MRSFINLLVPLTLVNIALTTPLISKDDDACLATVVNGVGGGPAEDTRMADCVNFLAVIVTEGDDSRDATDGRYAGANDWSIWRRGESDASSEIVPEYAKSCSGETYKNVCQDWIVADGTTFPQATREPTNSDYDLHRDTLTERPATGTKYPGDDYSSEKCVDDAKAKYFVDGFKELLEFTSYQGNQGPPGRGYHYNTSAAILAEDFQDWSDSINWMAGFPLGTVTFANRTAFDYGQGVLQPELKVTTLNIWHSCNTITWRWNAFTSSQASVTGINQMVLDRSLNKIKTNYAEFNNAAWLSSFGLQCKVSRT